MDILNTFPNNPFPTKSVSDQIWLMENTVPTPNNTFFRQNKFPNYTDHENTFRQYNSPLKYFPIKKTFPINCTSVKIRFLRNIVQVK